jgi:hypothetical protein
LQQLQLGRTGTVIRTVWTANKERDGAFRVQLAHEERLDEPGWFAVRIAGAGRNEFDQHLFAHSSPVYVDLAGRRVFDVEAARLLLKQLEEARADIRAKGLFSNEEARDRLLALYQQTTDDLVRQINQRGR